MNTEEKVIDRTRCQRSERGREPRTKMESIGVSAEVEAVWSRAEVEADLAYEKCRGRGNRVKNKDREQWFECRGRGWPCVRKKNRSFSGARGKINTGTIWINYASCRAEVVRAHPTVLTLTFSMMWNMEVAAKI